MAASQSQIQSKVQAHGHGRAPGQRRPICADCTKPLRLCLCGRLRSPPLDNAIGVTVLQHAQEAHHPLNSTRLARLGLRNLAVAQVTDVNHRACFLLRILNDATRSDLRGEKRSDLCTTLVGNDGDSNASRKIETESSHDFREKSGDHQGERFYLLTLHGGHCGYLDGKVSARSDSDKMNSWSGSIEKDAHLAGFGQVGGERMDHGAVHDRICCNLDVEFCGMGCTPDSGESFVCETKKMKNSDDFCEINGNRVDFWQDEAARADLGNSRMSVKNFKSDSDAAGELHVEGESCVTGGADAWCLAPTHMTSCSDRDQGISNCWNEAPCGASGVGGLGFASSQIEISGNLGQKLVDCGNELQSSNTCSVILPMNGEKSENSAVNVVNNGEYHHKLEKEVKYMVKDNLVHPLPANSSEFHLMPIHEFNGECKENIEVDAATQQNCTMKSMDKCEIAYTENELKIAIEHAVKPKIRWLSRAPIGQAAVSKGFVIMKIRTKKCNLTGEVWEFEEFSLTIPPGSALLFPCQHSTSIDASDCQVRHLIVLDGTWAKAQRMYHENPWLQLLPHLKLESDRVSLYSEVRHEPRAGCLSTIESIVCAMKKLGEDAEGLDDLLDVFESMIADQRRCKDENWKQKQKSLS